MPRIPYALIHRQRADQLRAELADRLPPDLFGLVEALVYEEDGAAEDQHHRWTAAFLDELDRHFRPLVGPSFAAIRSHLLPQRLADVGTCCEDPAREACNEDCDPERCPGWPRPPA